MFFKTLVSLKFLIFFVFVRELLVHIEAELFLKALPRMA